MIYIYIIYILCIKIKAHITTVIRDRAIIIN